METTTNDANEENASILKNRGNECVKNNKFKEAALLYTYAIKIEPNNEILYSNRSLVYLKLQQYSLALEDANKTICINPQWAKGYFRKAEAESSSGQFENAILSYGKALELLPNDPNLIEAMLKTDEALKKKTKSIDNFVWVCSCIGLILGVILTILDYTLSEVPTLTNPLLQVVFIQVIAGSFWLVGHTLLSTRSPTKITQENQGNSSYYILIGSVLGGSIVVIDATSFEILGLKTSAGRIFVTMICAGVGWLTAIILRHLQTQCLEETINEETIDEELNNETNENQIPEKVTNKYTKAQARYRYKKGKML